MEYVLGKESRAVGGGVLIYNVSPWWIVQGYCCDYGEGIRRGLERGGGFSFKKRQPRLALLKNSQFKKNHIEDLLFRSIKLSMKVHWR